MPLKSVVAFACGLATCLTGALVAIVLTGGGVETETIGAAGALSSPVHDASDQPTPLTRIDAPYLSSPANLAAAKSTEREAPSVAYSESRNVELIDSTAAASLAEMPPSAVNLVAATAEAPDFPSSVPGKPAADSLGVAPHDGHVESERVHESVPLETSSTAELITDAPYSLGMIRLTFAEPDRPIVRPDATLLATAASGRVLYPSCKVEFSDSDQHRVESVTCYFLAAEALAGPLSVAANGVRLSEAADIRVVQPKAGERGSRRREWWAEYTREMRAAPTAEREVRYHLARLLGSRLGLPAPQRPSTSSTDGSAIEGRFESAIRMFLGFDSVQLALQPDASLELARRHETADMSMPAALAIARVPVPRGTPAVSVEPIAHRTPAECFYVRCGTLANYLWLRELLVGWGGDLTDIVETKTLESYPRERIERQLAFDPRAAVQAGFDDHVADIALIGFDTLFKDGAGLGVLIQADSPSAAKSVVRLLERQRAAAAQAMSATEEPYHIDGLRVFRLTTHDYRVRSLLVVDGEYVLVTNSERMARRFVATGRHTRSLASLQEFRYARHRMPSDADGAAFIYLSDPFFRNQVSPKYRIEMQRRYQAKQDLQQARVARVAAFAEGVEVESLQQLIGLGYLPDDFLKRPDGGHATMRGGRIADSLRGAQGTFLPIADAAVGRATNSEVRAFKDFTCRYRQEWRLMDPVCVGIHHRPGGAGIDTVSLDIRITPYARNHYKLLRRHLAAPDGGRVAGHPDDLMSLSSSIKEGRQVRRLYAGLRDRRVEFEIERGGVTANGLASGTFGYDRFYLAMTPGSMQSLKDAATMLGIHSGTADFGDIEESGLARPAGFVDLVRGGPMLIVGKTLASAAASAAPAMRALSVSRRVEARGPWLVVGINPSFRGEVFDSLAESPSGQSSMLHFTMQDITMADVYPYVRAYTYFSTRERSADGARLLNSAVQQFGILARKAPDVVDFLYQAVPVCPLGGLYESAPTLNGPELWRSTAWQAPSRFDESEVPGSYEFAFVEWLRGIDVDFSLDASTLSAQVNLRVKQMHNTPKPFRAAIRPRPMQAVRHDTPSASGAGLAQPPKTREPPTVGPRPVLKLSTVSVEDDRVVAGQPIRVKYELTNESANPIDVPEKGSYSRSKYLIGNRRHWIQPLSAADAAPIYAGAGAVRTSGPVLAVDETLAFTHRIRTKQLRPGRYSLIVEFSSSDGRFRESSDVEVEVVSP